MKNEIYLHRCLSHIPKNPYEYRLIWLIEPLSGQWDGKKYAAAKVLRFGFFKIYIPAVKYEEDFLLNGCYKFYENLDLPQFFKFI